MSYSVYTGVMPKIRNTVKNSAKEMKMDTLQDIIKLGNMYKKKRLYNFNHKLLYRIVPVLKKLNRIIGLEEIKKKIVKQIKYILQDFHLLDNDMMHTIIEGPPGVGKTLLGEILAELYSIVYYDNDKPNFVKVKRSDLVGQYLGETAIKTQEVIDSCYQGVMFIDEAYSLGNPEKRDSFSKECIDTINRNLSERKSDFICIIAGYPNQLSSSFFAYNPGLERRFMFKYTIKDYSSNELYEIFMKKVRDIEWSVDTEDNDKIKRFFMDNHKSFKYYAGDVEKLLTHIKITHSDRVISLEYEYKTVIKIEDIERGYEECFKKEEEESFYKHLFI